VACNLLPRPSLDAWFEDSIGATVASEISRLRIERVKRELLACSDSVGTIAKRTGFACSRTLNNQFRKHTGLSPGEFRKARGHTRPRG
jgi:transcriptional regulator GlxA family with amidase domain